MKNIYLDRRLSVRQCREVARYLKSLGYRLATVQFLLEGHDVRSATLRLEPNDEERHVLRHTICSMLFLQAGKKRGKQ